VRQARYKRQVELGLVDPKTSPLPPLETGKDKKQNKKSKGAESPADELQEEATDMEVYAAMIDRVDQNIGRMIKKLEEQGKLDNTLIMFLSDNGANASLADKGKGNPNIPKGSVWNGVGQGPRWATASNTPLRKGKLNSFEGGICTPLVVHWPAGIKPQTGWNREPVHVIDIMPTVLAVTGAKYPGASKQAKIPPMDGVSLLPAFKGETIARPKPLFFQYGHGSAMRDGQWKLVRSGGEAWELYDMTADRTETRNLAAKFPELVKKMDAAWRAWWKDCTGSEWTGKAPREEEDG
jgi:arylsulfatase